MESQLELETLLKLRDQYGVFIEFQALRARKGSESKRKEGQERDTSS